MVTAQDDRYNKMFPIKQKTETVRQRESIKHRQPGNRNNVD